MPDLGTDLFFSVLKHLYISLDFHFFGYQLLTLTTQKSTLQDVAVHFGTFPAVLICKYIYIYYIYIYSTGKFNSIRTSEILKSFRDAFMAQIIFVSKLKF